MAMNYESHNTLEFFISKYKWVFIIAFIVLIIIGISVLFITQQSNTKSIEATIAFEALEEDYENFTQDYSLYEDHSDTIDAEKMDALVQSYKEITQKYPRETVAQKSFLNIGTIYAIDKKNEAALQYFSLAVQNGSIAYRTYLTPRALFNVAAMQENADSPMEAIATYQRIINEYPNDLIAPHAMFNIARINEQINETSIEAIGYYQLIVENEDWKDSKWVSIAKSRLALLQKLVDEDTDEATHETNEAIDEAINEDNTDEATNENIDKNSIDENQ